MKLYLTALGAGILACVQTHVDREAVMTGPDLILHNRRLTTLNRRQPAAEAVAITGGRITAVGADRDILPAATAITKVIDLGGRLVLPGLVNTHTHIIRGGLTFNMELR